MRLRFALPFAVTVSCLPSNLIHYALQPQEFKQDFGSATGTLPMVPCTMDSQCNAVPVPAGVMPSPTMSCDPAAHACMATFDVRVYQQVDLSTEPNFPSSVLNAVVQTVSIDAVHYWTPTNTLTFTTPTIELWVGPQSATSETSAGATQLGTIPPLPAGMRTACGSGAPGTADSECDVQLTDAGQNALAILAKDYRTPFNVIVVAHVIVHAGDALPAGTIDVFVQPVLAFGIPL